MALFIEQNFKKILTTDPELWGCTIFGPKMVQLPQTKNFSEKNINIVFIYLLTLFIKQNFKNILKADPELLGWCTIFGPKMAHLPKWKFFSEYLLISLVPFIHAYLHAKNQSQILMKYWRLKNTEISLAKSHFWLQLENQIFPKHAVFAERLLNHKNFRFTQIPEKTNDMIFLISPKTLSLDHFWSFLVFYAHGDFFQKIQYFHTQLYMRP